MLGVVLNSRRFGFNNGDMTSMWLFGRTMRVHEISYGSQGAGQGGFKHLQCACMLMWVRSTGSAMADNEMRHESTGFGLLG